MPLDTRVSFDSSLDPNVLIVELKSVSQLRDAALRTFKSLFNKFGVVVLRFDNDQGAYQALRALRMYFGRVRRHARSDASGIAAIEAGASTSDYLGTSTESHPPHTDGAYLKSPPRVVAMYCEVTAAKGGETILVSCKHLFKQLAKSSPDKLARLFDKRAILVQRANASAAHAVFFDKRGQISCVFRSDSTASTQVDGTCVEIFNTLRRLVLRPTNQVRLKLLPGDLIVIDNSAVLHGRTAFTPPRRLLRLTFDGKPSSVFQFVYGFNYT